MSLPSPATPEWEGFVELVGRRLEEQTEAALATLGELLKEATGGVRCSEAGLLVPADDDESLRFLVSVNSRPEAREILAQAVVPCDRSIAGYVFNTGQPIAFDRGSPTSAVQHYDEIDKKTGIETIVYLAVPVTQGDQTLGVQTFVNRPEGEEASPFSPEEMQNALGFAALSAVVLQFYRRARAQLQLAQEELQDVGRQPPLANVSLTDSIFGEDVSAASSPMARVLRQLESMSQEDQDLYADLVEVLADRLSQRSAE